MNNISHKNNWNQGTVQGNVESSLILLVKSENDEKSDKDCVKNKLPRYLTLGKSDLYEFKTSLFDNGNP